MEVIRGAINDLRGHNDSERCHNHTSHHLNKPDKKDNCINDSKGKWQLNRHGSTVLQKARVPKGIKECEYMIYSYSHSANMNKWIFYSREYTLYSYSHSYYSYCEISPHQYFVRYSGYCITVMRLVVDFTMPSLHQQRWTMNLRCEYMLEGTTCLCRVARLDIP